MSIESCIFNRRNGGRRGREQKKINVFEGSGGNGLSVTLDVVQAHTRIPRRHINALHRIIETTDLFDGFLETPLDLWLSPKIVGHSEMQFSTFSESVKVIARLTFLSLHEHINHQCGIFHGARHDAGVTEPADHLARILLTFKYSGGVNQAVGTLEAHHAATCSR